MALSKTKEILIHTRMTDLGLGSVFNKYFQSKGPIITLKEFFLKNTEYITYVNRHKQFHCSSDGTGFTLQSVALKKLIVFLKAQGFTQEDWIMLLPEPKQLKLFACTLLKKKDIMSMSIATIGLTNKSTNMFGYLTSILPGRPADITVAQVLTISKSTVDEFTGTPGNWNIPYDDVQNFRKFVVRLQAKLATFKITKEGNPFMEISFKKPSKSPKLPKKMGRPQMPLCKASHLPIPGKPQHYCPRLNWIQRFGNPVDYFSTERWYGTTATTTKEQAA